MTAPDISNIESKPIVVVVSNQSEYDQLMQHLEKGGKLWANTKRPTECKPVGFDFPYCIFIYRIKLTCSASIKKGAIAFPDYAAKHMKPKASKRDRIRIERKKYDAVVAERDRLKAENEALRKDNDIWRKAGRETEEQKQKAIELIELQKLEITQSNNSWETIISAYNALSKELDEAKNAIESKATEHAHIDTLAGKLRDQRDMARFIAAMFGLAAVGFAVAVWIGRLVPVT